DDLVYRTGDLGRYRADGALEILGRLDRQVKIRGVRVEPAEVESLLARRPGVLASAVVARPDAAGQPALVAYLVLDRPADGPATVAALRSALAGQRRSAAVPAAFVIVDALPITPNGKLDLAALPEPARAGAPARPPERPRTPTESALAAIWAEVLGRA